MENYCKVIHIEAKTMIKMVKNEILPALCSYTKELSSEILNKNKIGAAISSEYEMDNLKTLSDLTSKASKTLSDLIDTLEVAKKTYDLVEKADKYKKDVLENMNILRNIVDTMEFNMPRSYWPYPTYDDMLFSV